MMTLGIDTDAFCKLGRAGILYDAAAVLGVSPADCGRLPALPHMLKRGRLRSRYGEDACDALLLQANKMPPVADAAARWLDLLVERRDLDPGEAQLYALAAANPMLVLTGDKRGLIALSGIPEVVTAVSGRIVILESALLALCNRHGAENIRRRLAAHLDKDVMMRACFAPVVRDPVEGLRSYIAAASSEIYPLLLWGQEAL